MAILTKSIAPKKSFFWNQKKKMKIGQRWPAGTVRNGFRTPPLKYLTPFHKKIIVRSWILKKISSTKRGGISGQHGYGIIVRSSNKKLPKGKMEFWLVRRLWKKFDFRFWFFDFVFPEGHWWRILTKICKILINHADFHVFWGIKKAECGLHRKNFSRRRMTVWLVMKMFTKKFPIKHTNSRGHTAIVEEPNLFCKKRLSNECRIVSEKEFFQQKLFLKVSLIIFCGVYE